MEKILLTFAIRAISILITISSLYLVTELLNPAETGKYYNILTWMLFVSFFVRFGFDKTIIKLKNQLSCNSVDLYKKLFFIQLTIYGLFLFLLTFFWEFNSLQILGDYSYIFIVLASVIFYSNNLLISGYLTAAGKPGLGNFFAVGLLPLIFIIFMLSSYYVFNKDINLNYLSRLYFYSGFVVFIAVNFVIYYFNQQIDKSKNVFKMNKIIFTESGHVCIYEGLNFSLDWFVFFLGAIFISAEAIGELHIFARLTFFIAVPMAVMGTIVAPIYAKYFQKDSKLIQETIYISASISTLLSIIVSILMILFSYEILTLFDINNSENHDLFYFFIIVQLLHVIFGANDYVLKMFGRASVMRSITFWSFLATIIIFFFINLYSTLLAVPLSLIFGLLVKNMSANYYIYKKYKLICLPSLYLIKDLAFLRLKNIDNTFKKFKF
tara:strand:- start:139 stop:1452 length:1314 start_codon:yes stop_codon:yes gene_type:complete